jgi:hypothetical protein
MRSLLKAGQGSEEIARVRSEAGGADESTPSRRFVLVWETDANDVDFHRGPERGHRGERLVRQHELHEPSLRGVTPEDRG